MTTKCIHIHFSSPKVLASPPYGNIKRNRSLWKRLWEKSMKLRCMHGLEGLLGPCWGLKQKQNYHRLSNKPTNIDTISSFLFKEQQQMSRFLYSVPLPIGWLHFNNNYLWICEKTNTQLGRKWNSFVEMLFPSIRFPPSRPSHLRHAVNVVAFFLHQTIGQKQRTVKNHTAVYRPLSME